MEAALSAPKTSPLFSTVVAEELVPVGIEAPNTLGEFPLPEGIEAIPLPELLDIFPVPGVLLVVSGGFGVLSSFEGF